MISFRYRADVDGLRAIAVLLVLLFHLELGFQGGYVGVDIFFVISGYLITGLILKEQAEKRFRLRDFWARRVRRILPASSAVSIATLVAGYFLLLPSDYEELGRSTVAHQLMSANVFFWTESGYFGGESELKPLLHTWSLSVEEQFYLFYPLLLIAPIFVKSNRKRTLVLAILVSSLAISQFGVENYPTAAFYLLPSRAWEMLLGGILWFVPSPKRLSKRLISALSWLSVIAILSVGWAYSSSTSFPGFSAFLPCAATALLIYANAEHSSLVAKILATKPFVSMGLISYSVYLWHWPILALYRYWSNGPLAWQAKVMILVASLLFGFLSWRYIETPFRRRPKTHEGRKACLLASVSLAANLGIAAWVLSSDGFRNRLTSEAIAASEVEEPPLHLLVEKEQLNKGVLPVIGTSVSPNDTPDFILWGDSHALALAESFNDLAREYSLSGVIAARPGVIPFLEIYRPNLKGGNDDVIRWNREVVRVIRDKKIVNVILVGRWAASVEGRQNQRLNTLIGLRGEKSTDRESARNAFEKGLASTLDSLRDAGARVWILQQVPLQQSDPRRAVAFSAFYRSKIPDGVTLRQHTERQQFVARSIADAAGQRDGVFAPDLAKNFFPSKDVSAMGDSNGSYYRDKNHVSRYGAKKLCEPIIRNLLEQIRDRVTD